MAPEEVTHAPFLPGDYIIVIGGKGHDFRKKNHTPEA